MQTANIRLVYCLPLLAVALLLNGCSIRTQDHYGDDDWEGGGRFIPDAIPRNEPRSKYGNPPSYVVHGQRYYVMDSSRGFVERGVASWYGPDFHGKRTSSGETYDMYKMTAAHKNLPLPTYVRVSNLENGRSVVVRVNDRGPFHEGRIIDLSYTAAQKLDVVRSGTARVEVRALDAGLPRPAILTQARQSSRPVSKLVRAMASTPAPPADASSGEIYIQAGAFSSESSAQNLRDQLADSLKREVRVQSTGTLDSLLYRVQVGPLAHIDHIIPVSQQMQELGYTSLRVIID